MEQKTEFPNSQTDIFSKFTDRQIMSILKNTISNIIVDNNIYHDTDEVKIAVEALYPVVFYILFNSQLNLRHSEKEVVKLITLLATHWA